MRRESQAIFLVLAGWTTDGDKALFFSVSLSLCYDHKCIKLKDTKTRAYFAHLLSTHKAETHFTTGLWRCVFVKLPLFLCCADHSSVPIHAGNQTKLTQDFQLWFHWCYPDANSGQPDETCLCQWTCSGDPLSKGIWQALSNFHHQLLVSCKQAPGILFCRKPAISCCCGVWTLMFGPWCLTTPLHQTDLFGNVSANSLLLAQRFLFLLKQKADRKLKTGVRWERGFFLAWQDSTENKDNAASTCFVSGMTSQFFSKFFEQLSPTQKYKLGSVHQQAIPATQEAPKSSIFLGCFFSAVD